jgi:hypothetical protein
MSTTATDKLVGVQFKTTRAKQHLADLEETLRAFFASKPYKVGTRRDPQSRRLVYSVTSVADTTPRISLVAGEVLQNLRSALDHLGFQLYLTGTGGGGGPGRHIQFPIFDGPAKYRSESPRRLQGMRPDAIKAIGGIEPYQGGNGHHLWVLSELNNTDKHRLLITVASAFRSVNLGAHVRQHLQKVLGDKLVLPALDAFFRPADRLCPLKVGDVLFSDGPDADVTPDLGFRFDVALSEPPFVDGEPLFDTLQKLVQCVEGVVAQLAPLL